MILLPAALLFLFLPWTGLATWSPQSNEHPGKTPYTRVCLVCHGVEGRGDAGPALVPLDKEYEEVLATVREGGGQMPPFASERVSDEEVRQIVDYLKSLKAAASEEHAHAADAMPASHAAATIPAELLERPVALRRGSGFVHELVSTRSPEAQAFYDQGLAYLHSYVWIEAARSFHQALRLDSRLAMANVGLSYAEWELNRPAAARAAIGRARALARNVSEREQRRVALRELEFAAIDRPRDPMPAVAYRRALDEALSRDSSDLELWLLRGLAEAPTPGDRGQGSTAGSIPYYERALAVAGDSFAAHHYLAHACENAGRIEDALGHGAAYARLAPAVPHAHHMHGHDLRRVGRIDDAIAEFQTAYDLEIEYSRSEHVPLELDWHHQHNLDLLATSFQYVGQMKAAERLFRTSFALPSSLIVQEFNKREWPAFLLARGRWEEAAAAAARMIDHPSPIISATGHVLAGRASLGAGRPAEAATHANTALKLLESITEGTGLVAMPFEALQGEFFLRTGQRDKGRAMLERVVRTVRAQTGPDEWTEALFALEDIARAARDVGDWEFARRIAREMREHDPAYAGTHYALGLVASHAGDRSGARAEFALAAKYWSKADADLPEVRDARSRAGASIQ
jgi:tetratricopeptide (TPR) repeat protein